MDQNSFKIDENNEDFQEIIKEANKVLLILPHVPLIEIIKDISNLPKEVRLSRTYLENYFHKNDLENGFNENNFKIDNIRSIFPDVSREKIEADLKDIEKPNKVLHVVKRYLCEKTSVTASLKRTSDDENEEKANAKKLKVCSDNINCEISTIDNTYYSDSENNSKNISVLSALTDVLPNKSMVDLIVICNKYGYKCHDKISIGELNTLLEQILCEKQTSVFEGQQPSTSSCRFNEASTSGQQSSNCQASQETISTCANDLTETYDFKEEDFLTQIDRTSSPVPNQEENTSSLPVPNQHETKQVETKEENSTSLKPDQVEPNSNRSTIIINKNNLLGESSSSTKNENKKEETITNELRNETIDLTAESQVAPTATIDLSYDSDNDSVYGECDINKLKTLYEDDSLEADDSLEEPLTKTQKNLDNFINELVGTLNMPLVENKSNGAIPKVLNKVENQYNGRPFVNGIDLTKPGPSNINNAVAHPPKANPNMDKIKIKVMQMFPDICPDYLERCLQVHAVQNIEQIIDILLGVDYPKREIKRERTPPRELDFDEEVALLEELFPDCDPTYLHTKCEEFVRFNNREALQEFINRSLEKKDYPTKTEYLRKLKLSAQEKKYTTEFSVENFLEVIPDPVEYFNKPGRSSYVHLKMDPEFDKYYGYVKQFFRNHFVNLYVADINTAILKGKTFTETAEILEKVNSKMKMKRKPCPLPSCSNIPVLQELAYIKHKKEILDYMEKKKKAAEQMRLLAKQNGLLKTCECCYDEEIMPEDIITCDNQHEFCKTCVKKSAEVLIGDGKTNFPCLATCDQEFSLKVLQIVLPPKLFSKLAIKKQLEEIKSAGIEDLTSCPFCDFATILPPTEKVFRCLNEECMKESCRECKEPSHIPLRCNEVEKDEDIKKRKYIEDKMTEALLRTCYQCGLKFVKEGGCNKMTCSCGAKMCYLCNKPVTDYKHFNGQGGDQHHLCPLFSDTVKLHEEAVKAGAVKAKEELGIRNSDLKVDPTADLEKHFADVKRRNPHNDVQIQNGHPVAPIRQLIPNNVQRPLPQGAFHNVAQNAAGILHQQRRIIQNLREALQQGPP